MSDAVIISVVGSCTTTVGLIVVAWLNTRQIKQSKKEIVSKVDEYHKEVNGKMGTLLETTEALGKEIGRAEEKANPTK